MKYVCMLNGKKYEVVIEREDDFTPLTYAQAAAAPAPAAPISAPAGIPAAAPAPVSTPAAAAPAPAAPAPAPAPAAPAPAAAPAASGGELVTAPMPGNILEVLVSVGQQVSAGDTVLTMEAMKMENEMVASKGGTVKEIRVKKGDVVNTDDVLIVIG